MANINAKMVGDLKNRQAQALWTAKKRSLKQTATLKKQ